MAEDPNVDNRHCFAAPAEPSHQAKKAKLSPQSAGIKRLFPGPAGLLTADHVEVARAEPAFESYPSQTDLCSQNTSRSFQEGPWKDMAKDSEPLYDHFNIAWIKGQPKGNQSTIQKIPFLAGVVLFLEVVDRQSQKSVNVTLRDPTGTIRGNIVQSLYEEHEPLFTVGAVLVLVEFGVLSCSCDHCDNHHLTITPKNLSAIYGPTNLVIRPISPQDVLKSFQRKQEEILEQKNNRVCRPRAVSRPAIAALQMQKRAQFRRNPATSGNPTRKLFTFKKLGSDPPSPHPHKEAVSKKPNGEGKGTCVTVADVAHEQLWKEMLSDVDLDALFEDDF
ncbi:hypothetical protein HUJ05_005954 [Dendroctonus ponderosae]|nr:hypothetical protein HUJ05_005954 [Dendroctonus ponderosae]